MPKYGPGTKVVLRGINNMLPDELKQRSEKDQGPGTRLVLKGLKRALPNIAERNEQHLRKREPVPGNGRQKPKQRPSKPENRKSHKTVEETTQALIPYGNDTSNRKSHREDTDRQEERNSGEEIEEEIAPRKRASKIQEHSAGSNGDRHSDGKSIKKEEMSEHRHTKPERHDSAGGTGGEQAERKARTSRSRQPSVGQHGSKHEKGSPSRSTFSQRGFRDV